MDSQRWQGRISSAALTVALPGGRRPCVACGSGPEEEPLTSADFFSSGPLSSSRGGAPPARSRSDRGDPGAPVADPLLGMILADRYRIVESIGRGGMGVVYKVQHTRIGKLLAMKVLSGEMSQNPEVVRRFKREALAVSKLGSPNTVQVFDFGVSEGLTYLVMELVSGRNLGRVLQAEGPMPFMRLGRIVLQVCNSLAEAHRKGIVHRDVKPENVMLVPVEGGGEVAKVLDFGLAKLREGEGVNDVTCQGTIVGTPNYMAPEQIQGLEVDARTDVYSVGALMYRLATGHTPFRAASPMAVLSKHLHEIPIPPADRAPELGIPLGFSRLVMRALRKDPGDRFATVEALQALLVEELRVAASASAASSLTSSLETLLDPSRLRRAARPEPGGDAALRGALATRDEVDAYERSLRRKRYGTAGAAAGLALAAAGAGASFLVPRDTGVEIEPNDTAAEATPLPLGRAMTGRLGKRLDESHGDRDFYAFELPATSPGAPGFLRLRVSALPSIATCAMLYRPGFADAVGQYCAGRPGRDLLIPALALEPGRYLVAILQDRSARGGVEPYVYESISDTYTVQVERTTPEPGSEVEPNDHVPSATAITLGQPCSAAIGWARDEDFFCVPAAATGPIRWSLRAGASESGVLEATPMHGEDAGAPVRIHLDPQGKRSDADVPSPWQSAPISADDAAPRCLRVRLAADPWAPDRGGGGGSGTPGGSSAPYVVEAQTIL
jgi:eukaryotic-like serine/threonine-protein kinase